MLSVGCYDIGFVRFCDFGFDCGFVVIGFGGFVGRFVGNLVLVGFLVVVVFGLWCVFLCLCG